MARAQDLAGPLEERRDTICALSSPPGTGARAVVRLSGPDALAIVREAFRDEAGEPLGVPKRGVVAGSLDDGGGLQPALLLWMPGPGSFTREDVAELHLVGNPHLVTAALERLHSLGARAATAGEFTRRAFEHGALDLTRAEGILSLVHAAGEAEQRAATALLMGGLDGRLEALRDLIEELRALLEASLDFDENDTGHVPLAQLLELGDRARAALEEATRWEVARHAPQAGAPRVVLAGPPNAGKSSLFNALLDRGAGGGGAIPALVDARAGSTRDARAALLRLGPEAQEVLVVDTAGLEDGRARALSALEGQAQERARLQLDAADLVVGVLDAGLGGSVEGGHPELPAGTQVLAWNQVDRQGVAVEPPAGLAQVPWIATSAVTGAGLEGLVEAVLDGLASRGSEGFQVSARHRGALATAHEALRSGLAELAQGAPLDLVAEGLRAATVALDDITGRTTPEDLLDRIFARFCLGK